MKRIFLFMLLGACSGNSQPFDGDGGADATTTDAKPKSDAGGSDAVILGDSNPDDTGSGNDAGVDGPNPDLGCLTDDAGCVACCYANHPGADTYFGTLTTCACDAGASCHSVSKCYNWCKGGNLSTACDQCLSNPDAGDCYANADKACGADNDCVAFFDCVGNVCSPPPADASAD